MKTKLSVVAVVFMSISAQAQAQASQAPRLPSSQAVADYMPTVPKQCEQPNQLSECIAVHEVRAELGKADSAYWMGKSLAMTSVEDYSEAAPWFAQASAAKHINATNELALLHYHGSGLERDFAKAKALFEQAAEMGSAEAHWNLARMYHFGRGVEQDHLQALSLFKQAASLGAKAAPSTLSYYYKQGLGTEVDLELANYWGSKGSTRYLVSWNY